MRTGNRRSAIANATGVLFNQRLGNERLAIWLVLSGYVRRLTGPDALDHAADVVVADRLAMLAHGDDRVIDLRQFVARQGQSELFGALPDRMATRVAAEHELVRVLPDVSRPHDLVGPSVLQHPVLVNAGFVREGVAADDRLVRLYGF